MRGEGQWKRPAAADREPIHGLVLNPRRIPNGCWVTTQRSKRLDLHPPTGVVRRRWTTGTEAVPGSIAMLFGFEPGTRTVQRVMLLAIDDEPILTSASYMPVELAGNDAGWRDVEVGQLALTGHDIWEGSPRAMTRMPIPGETKLLGMDRDVPVHVVHQPYRVIVDERTSLAGVIVTARGDRVYLQ